MTAAIQIDRGFRQLIAPLSVDERDQLEANLVAAKGARDPLVVWDGLLLDGHNRYEICRRLDLPFKIRTVTLPDRTAARIWIRWNQLGRRNLTDDQRAMQVAGLVEDLAAQSRHARAATAVDVREQKAGRRPISGDAAAPKIKQERVRAKTSKRARVSERKVKRAQLLKRRAPALAKKVAAGALTLVEAVRQIKPQIRAEKLAAAVWPEGKYGVMLADPPWRPDEGLLDPTRRIENQYPTLTLPEIVALAPQVAALAAADCVLLLWATTQKIAEATAVIEAWGFTVKSGAVWIKNSIGMGYWFRARHELLILATRGAPMTPLEANRPDSVIVADRKGHSEKPDVVYRLIEQMFPGVPKVELFARAQREGWAHGTNESALRSA